jgi:GH25 family lysozyme M1 (1,4-beta-N-acetylmuramidase)
MAIIPLVADMAHFNPVNFTELKDVGFVGIIHKARQGVGVGDPKYAARMAAAKTAGLRWGAYDFATHDDVAANVAAFLATARLEPTDSAWLDFEDNAHSQMTGKQAYEFLDRVAQKRGRACGIYGGNRIREQINPHDAKWIDMAENAPLWQCRYVKLQPADNADLFRVIAPIPPWTKNFLIQYTGDGVGPRPHTAPGLENGADLNAFNGTAAELATAWAGRAAQTPTREAASLTNRV